MVAPDGQPRLAVSPEDTGRGVPHRGILPLRGQCGDSLTGMFMRPASSTELRWSAYGFAQSDVSQPILWLPAQAHRGVVLRVRADGAGVQEWIEAPFSLGDAAVSPASRIQSDGGRVAGLGDQGWRYRRPGRQCHDAGAANGVLDNG